MQSFERDFFISRIRCGYLRIKFNDQVFIYTSPSRDLAYEANCVYNDYYEECLSDGSLDDEKTYQLLLDFNLWNEEKQELLTKKVPEYLENAKVEMWKSFHKKDEVRRMRLYLDRAREELVDLFEVRHQFDYLSCHGAALFARWQFIVENCVKYKDGSTPNWDKINTSSLLATINENSIEETVIRELARTDPWSTIWSINKKNQNIFGIPSADFSEDQKRLVGWSILLDNVSEMEDAPSEDLIEDDDCFDGWLINRKRQQKQESEADEIQKRLGKNANADEIFVPVRTQLNNDESLPDLDAVLGMNNPMTRQIINSRVNAVQKHGILKESELPDVRLKLGMMSASRKV